MKLLFLIGPPAVGKMTVGQEIERRTDLKLFHNHVAIEAVAPFFSYGTPEGRKLVGQIRAAFFDAFVKSKAPGYIFTFVWAFGVPGEKEYIEAIAAKFADAGYKIYLAELNADLDTRLARNRSENRLAHKPTKRDVEWSDGLLLEHDAEHRFTSHPGEIDMPNYLRLETTNMSAAVAADRIIAFMG